MFITVVKPHYRLDTRGCFHLVTRRGEFVFASMFLGDPATPREARQAGCPDEAKDGQGDIEQDKRTDLEAAIQGLRPKRERKSIKYKTTRVFEVFNGARAVGA
jgi:hypothetical protein